MIFIAIIDSCHFFIFITPLFDEIIFEEILPARAGCDYATPAAISRAIGWLPFSH
jgi:hypothetical protein